MRVALWRVYLGIVITKDTWLRKRSDDVGREAHQKKREASNFGGAVKGSIVLIIKQRPEECDKII